MDFSVPTLFPDVFDSYLTEEFEKMPNITIFCPKCTYLVTLWVSSDNFKLTIFFKVSPEYRYIHFGQNNDEFWLFL